MKKFLFFILLASCPLLQAQELSDEALRILAKTNALRSTPLDFKELKELAKKANNPLSIQKIDLGRTLFFEPLLSRDETLNCASCHLLALGGDDNLATAVGFAKRVNPKHLNTPTVLDASLSKFLFWDGRAKSVEEQATGPIEAHFEMNMTASELIERLKKNTMHQKAFEAAFDDGITFANVAKAIGAFERTLLTRGAYDAFLDGYDKAISQDAKKGLALFVNQGCTKCHYGATLGGQSLEKYPKYGTNFPFENTGGFRGQNDQQIIRVPLLRNITKTAPYYHNGAIKSLEEVIKIESKASTNQQLSKEQISNILEFFKTLNGEIVYYDVDN